MEATRKAKQALEDEELTSPPTTQIVAHSGTAPDESAANSVDYSRRDNSIVTQLLAPGSAVVT
jgi:hypothetical protein